MFRLGFSTATAAFQNHPTQELSDILYRLQESVARGETTGTVRDSNGHDIGRWSLMNPNPTHHHHQGDKIITKLTRKQAAAVRAWYGHGTGTRRVSIRADGSVHGTGSTDPYDRSRDGTRYHLGHVDDAMRAMGAR